MKYARLFLLIIIAFTLFVSLRTLTSQPRYFYDEAVVVETAHSFATSGKLDVMVSPGVLTGYSHLFNSTGYPVSLPLALIFKLSHVSFTYGRLMMAGWLVITILSLFYIVKSFWDERAALLSSALVATFAPFYGNGMQIMGEIPGFVFLLWGFYQLFNKKSYILAGLLLGLAAATKPSIYGLILPSFAIYLFFFEENRFHNLKNFIIGCAGPLSLYLILVVPHIFSPATWIQMIQFYRNPYDSPSLLHNALLNIKTYWHHSTIVYFSLLLIAIIFLVFRNRYSTKPVLKKLYALTFIYMAFLVFYFLRSPGWFRYLLPLELLTLMLIYPAISVRRKRLAFIIVSLLIVVNVIQLFFFRGDIKETFAQDAAAYVTNLHQSVGVINAPEVSSLIPTDQRYQVMKYLGVPEMGSNPLLFEGAQKTQLIIFKSSNNPMVIPYRTSLDTYYQPLNQIGSYRVYKLK